MYNHRLGLIHNICELKSMLHEPVIEFLFYVTICKSLYLFIRNLSAKFIQVYTAEISDQTWNAYNLI